MRNDRVRADELVEALGQQVGVYLDRYGDVLAEGCGMNHAGGVREGAAGVADGHGGVGHGLHVRSTTGLLVGDRCCADGCRDGHLALAEVRQPGLQLGDGLVACQARKIHRADVHAGQNTVAVGAGEGESDRREKGKCRDGANNERNYETDRTEIARSRRRCPRRRGHGPGCPLGLRSGNDILRQLGWRVNGGPGRGRREGHVANRALALLLRPERVRGHLFPFLPRRSGNRR